MTPTQQQVQTWWNALDANDKAKVEQPELAFAKAARPHLKKANLINDSTTDQEVMEALRMRF